MAGCASRAGGRRQPDPEGVCRADQFLLAAGAERRLPRLLGQKANLPTVVAVHRVGFRARHDMVTPFAGRSCSEDRPVALRGVLMFGKRYLVPRGDGHMLVGSTEENPKGFEKANTAEGVGGAARLREATVTRLADREAGKVVGGLRPGSPDGMPFIGPVPGWDNVFVAAGHFRAGVQLSIGTAQAITELLTGKPTCVPLEAFALHRMPDVNLKQAFRS